MLINSNFSKICKNFVAFYVSSSGDRACPKDLPLV